MILQRLTAVGTDGSRVTLWFDDGTKMKVASRLVVDYGLYAGMTLTEEDLAALQDGAKKASARDRAVRIVSATTVSERELKRRLVQKGERPEDASEAVDWLRDLGAVDDAAMASRVVQRALDKGYGPSRIRQELYQKGIPREYWEEAMASLPDMGPAIDRFLQQRLRGQDPDEKTLQRTVAALQRRGHSWADIHAALSRYRIELDADDYYE